MIETTYLCIPIVTAFIGWITNVVAVKMLFYPKKPWRFLFFRIHGLVPSRHEEMAVSVAKIFEEELLSGKELVSHFQEIDLEESVSPLISEKLSLFLNRLKGDFPMLGMFLNEELESQMKEKALTELVSMLPQVQELLAEKLHDCYNIRLLIEEKIRAFSIDRLEAIVMQVATKELTTIERLGAVLGFVVGLAQMFLMHYLSLNP